VADLRPLTWYEGNAVTLAVSITADDPADSLLPVTSLEVYVKDRECTGDADATVLTSADPTQIVITTHTAVLIEADVYLPAAATTPPYPRVWRLDALVGASRRTAAYGPVAVVDL